MLLRDSKPTISVDFFLHKIIFYDTLISGKFLRSVTQTANKVSILENMDENSEMVDEIFGRPRSFWEGKARKWSEDGSMKVEVLSGTKYWQGNRFVLEVSA